MFLFFFLLTQKVFFTPLFYFPQSQLDVYRCENERLHAGETAALTSVRQNAQVASKYLIKVAQDAETSIKYVNEYNFLHHSDQACDDRVCIFCPQAAADRKRDLVPRIRAAEFNRQDH